MINLFLIFLIIGAGITSQTLANEIKYDKERGKYLFNISGCKNCHTQKKDGNKLPAGGVRIKTPFGIFYGSNITPDKEFGIGDWRDMDFLNALKKGISPTGNDYFPVFPYNSYTQLTNRDILDIKSYIFSLPPVAIKNIKHELKFPKLMRKATYFWKLLFFKEGDFEYVNQKSPNWNRGAYLVRAVAHCGECHSPRNIFGGIKNYKSLSGNMTGLHNLSAPNITPDIATGIGNWKKSEFIDFLQSGMLPNGDFTGGKMAEVIDNFSVLKRKDTKAITDYILSLKPIKGNIGG